MSQPTQPVMINIPVIHNDDIEKSRNHENMGIDVLQMNRIGNTNTDINIHRRLPPATPEILESISTVPNSRQNDSSSSNMQFEFIQMKTVTGKRDFATESQIRSHAMKQVHNRRRLNGKAVHKSKDKLPINTITQNRTHFTLVDRIKRHDDIIWGSFTSDDEARHEIQEMQIITNDDESATTSKSISTLSAWNQPRFDFYNQLGIPVSRRMRSLFDYMTQSFCPVPNIDIYGLKISSETTKSPAWFEMPMAMTDPAAFHVFCSLASYHQAMRLYMDQKKHKNIKSERLRLKNEEATHHQRTAMKIVNSRFNQHREALSSSTITVVSDLVIAAAISNNEKILNMHYEAFIKLVQRRGGINTFPRNESHHHSRIDTNSAWTTATSPRFPMYNSPMLNKNQQLQNPFSDLNLRNFLWHSLYIVAVDFYNLSWILEDRIKRLERKSLETNIILYFEDTYAACQHALADLPHPINSISSVIHFRQHCWRCAGIIYLNIAVRKYPAPITQPTSLAVQRIMDSLPSSDISNFWNDMSHILLWIIFM